MVLRETIVKGRDRDYAEIQGFNENDRIQIYGSSSQYSVEYVGVQSEISYKGDLIAIVKFFDLTQDFDRYTVEV